MSLVVGAVSALINRVVACSVATSLPRLGHQTGQALTAFFQDVCLRDPAMLYGEAR